MTATRETPDSAARGRAGEESPPSGETPSAEPPPLRYVSVLFGLWMCSVLGFASFVFVLFVTPSIGLAGIAAVLWLGPPLIAGPLMLYDASLCRGTTVENDMWVDPLVTALGYFLIYPLGGLAYVTVRTSGAYQAAIGVDRDRMDYVEELELGFHHLMNPTTGGLPAPWPVMMIAIMWMMVLYGDGYLLAALLGGDLTGIVGAAVVAFLVRLICTPILLYDIYLLSKTEIVSPDRAAVLAAVTSICYPIAVVGYLPYRIFVAYE